MRRTFAVRHAGALICRHGMTRKRILLLAATALFPVLAFVAYRGAVRSMMDMRQRAMFMAIEGELELFHNTFGKYPPSDGNDVTGLPYCGAMKLAEAMLGRDLQGFHSKSVFRGDGMDRDGRSCCTRANRISTTSRRGTSRTSNRRADLSGDLRISTARATQGLSTRAHGFCAMSLRKSVQAARKWACPSSTTGPIRQRPWTM
jgi:hypothetical protein